MNEQLKTSTVRCLICRSAQLSSRGVIHHPQPTRVAGNLIDLEGKEFHLIRCMECGFQFKNPMIPEEKLLACYSGATGDHWGLDVDPAERNFDRMRDIIEHNATGRRILDIGCFNGAFLKYLGGTWERFGVEPCLEARKVAETRMVNVLGDTINDIPDQEKFDVITAFDVLEHIVNPLPFFSTIKRFLAPNGIFVASSGDTDTLGWRLQGARYWYCSYLPEHVSFYNRKSLDFIANFLEMQTICHDHMSHKRTSLSKRLAQGVTGYVYGGLFRANWFWVPNLRDKFDVRAGTAWTAATDHFLHVMKRT